MNDRTPVCRSGQIKPSTSSVTMEDRDVLRRMERERRSQEVLQEETQYDRIAPLFSEPFKRIRGDELSSRIQNMLGNYEDGSDEFPVVCLLELDGPPALGPPALGPPALGPPALGLPALGLPALGLPALGLPALGLPALGPPVLPLSPLPASDSSLSPDLSIHRPDVPPLMLTLNLPCKLANTKKPTAYVRPMDGQDQVTSDSPRLKASPGRLQDLKESSEPSLPPLQSVDASVDSVRVASGKRAEDILQEMTSWPPLLMSICTPSSAEPPRVLDTKEESHEFTALKAHESSDSVQREQQVASGSSSDSDSSSDTDSENNRSPDQQAADEPSNTQTEKGCDWQLGRWLERKEDQHQQYPGSPCDIIKANSHDTAGRIESAGQQGCYSNQCDSGRVADGRQTVESTCTRGNLPLGSTSVEISQHAENASRRRSKHKRVKTSCDTKQKKTTTIANVSKQTCGKPLLLVKIQLNLLSRIPQEPKGARHRTGLMFSRIHQEPRILQEPRIPQEPRILQEPKIPQEPRILQEPKAARHRNGQTTACKRTAESDEKFPNKKQKLDVEGKKVFSSQQSLHQKEASKSSKTMMMKKKRNKSMKHSSSVPPEPRRDVGHKCRSDGQLRKAEAHGKKHCKSRSVFPEEPRPPTPEAHRQRSVEDHMKEAKKLKHKADATLDKMAKALCYLEAALAFVESAIAMETEPETPKSAYTIFSETLDLIRFILKLKNYTDPSATARERDFFILCLRCQSLLQMAMFRYRRDSALRYSRTLADHFRSSSWSASPSVSKSSVVSPVSSGSGSLVVPQHIQQAAASYVSITTLFLSAHETWEQADDLMTSGTGLLRELDSTVAPLTLTASMISLVTYIRLGLHRIRCDTQNRNQL